MLAVLSGVLGEKLLSTVKVDINGTHQLQSSVGRKYFWFYERKKILPENACEGCVASDRAFPATWCHGRGTGRTLNDLVADATLSWRLYEP